MSEPSKDTHGTVRRARKGFAHAILLDQSDHPLRWQLIDVYGPMELLTDDDVKDWPVVYVPIPDEMWRNAEWTSREGCECETLTFVRDNGDYLSTTARQCLNHFLD